MAEGVYKSNVRIGNWYENKLEEELSRQKEAMRKETFAEYRRMVAEFLKEEELSVNPDQLLHLGDRVLLRVSTALLNKGGPLERRGKVTVSIAPSSQAVARCLSLAGSPLTASPLYHQPCYRNVFTILPRLPSQSAGDVLCYGEVFDLAFVTGEKEVLYVSSPPGVAIYSDRATRRQEVLLDDVPSSYSAWRLVPNSNQGGGGRGEDLLVGKPVEVGERVRIMQMMTNVPLVVEEEVSLKTIFGQEPDMSAGVVNRATTRAAPVFTILTNLKPPPERVKTPPEDY